MDECTRCGSSTARLWLSPRSGFKRKVCINVQGCRKRRVLLDRKEVERQVVAGLKAGLARAEEHMNRSEPPHDRP